MLVTTRELFLDSRLRLHVFVPQRTVLGSNGGPSFVFALWYSEESHTGSVGRSLMALFVDFRVSKLVGTEIVEVRRIKQEGHPSWNVYPGISCSFDDGQEYVVWDVKKDVLDNGDNVFHCVLIPGVSTPWVQ